MPLVPRCAFRRGFTAAAVQIACCDQGDETQCKMFRFLRFITNGLAFCLVAAVSIRLAYAWAL
jgi:hypothetical protein